MRVADEKLIINESGPNLLQLNYRVKSLLIYSLQVPLKDWYI